MFEIITDAHYDAKTGNDCPTDCPEEHAQGMIPFPCIYDNACMHCIYAVHMYELNTECPKFQLCAEAVSVSILLHEKRENFSCKLDTLHGEASYSIWTRSLYVQLKHKKSCWQFPILIPEGISLGVKRLHCSQSTHLMWRKNCVSSSHWVLGYLLQKSQS